MIRFGLFKNIIILLISYSFLIGVSFSLTYNILNPEEWNITINPEEMYKDDSGWTTYSLNEGSFLRLNASGDGIFYFAWKMNLTGQNGL